MQQVDKKITEDRSGAIVFNREFESQKFVVQTSSKPLSDGFSELGRLTGKWFS